MAKKTKEPVILDLNIKMADKKTSNATKSERPIIDSPIIDENICLVKRTKENMLATDIIVVNKAIQISREIENLEVELSGLEKIVIESAKAEKDKQFKENAFVKTVDVAGTDMRMQIQFRDAYSKMDISMREPLKAIFGDKYSIMFTETKTQTLRAEKLEALKDILGDRFNDFFVIDESLKPSSDFQANNFAFKTTLKPEQKATVEKVLAACQSTPAVKYPK
jgi:hypothetical protein